MAKIFLKAERKAVCDKLIAEKFSKVTKEENKHIVRRMCCERRGGKKSKREATTDANAEGKGSDWKEKFVVCFA